MRHVNNIPAEQIIYDITSQLGLEGKDILSGTLTTEEWYGPWPLVSVNLSDSTARLIIFPMESDLRLLTPESANECIRRWEEHSRAFPLYNIQLRRGLRRGIKTTPCKGE